MIWEKEEVERWTGRNGERETALVIYCMKEEYKLTKKEGWGCISILHYLLIKGKREDKKY